MNLIRQNRGCIVAIVGSLSSSLFAAGTSDTRAVSAPLSTSTAAVGTPAAKYEVAPGAKRKVAPVYPYELLVSGRSGWAEASFVIDYSGRPLFANPKRASDPAFAKSIVAMIEASQYIPGRRDKHSVMSPASERYQFAGEESLDPDARRVLATLRHGGGGLATASELDERPKAVRQDSPAYPRALKDDGLTGQAEIEFVIDRDGRVLFPRIVSASHEDFGWAAATAVAQWRFQPPQKGGQQVDALMRVPILFDAHKLASSD
jgi:TonB family protein